MALIFSLIACGPAVGSGDGATGTDSGTTGAPGSSSNASTVTTSGAASSTTEAVTVDGSGSGDASSTEAAAMRYCLETEAPQPSPVADRLADVDGDGAPDVWAVALGTFEGEPGQLFGQRVDGLDLVGRRYDFAAVADGFAFADIDGDGGDDVVRSNEGTLFYHPGQSRFSVAERGVAMTVTHQLRTLVWVDWDGDGDDDILRFTDDGSGLERLRNDATSFVSTGIADVEGSGRAFWTAAQVLDSSLVTVSVQEPSNTVLLDGGDVVATLGSASRLAGGYTDESGPVGVSIEGTREGRIVRFDADGVRDEGLLDNVRGAVVGTVDGVPLLLAQQTDGTLRMVSLLDDQDIEVEGSLMDVEFLWDDGGIGPTGQVLVRSCSLAGCRLVLGHVSAC